MKKIAIQSALRLAVSKELFSVSEVPEFSKVKDAIEYLKNTGISSHGLLLVHKDKEKIYKFTKNIQGIKTVDVVELNTYDVVTSQNVLMMEDALEALKEKLLDKDK